MVGIPISAESVSPITQDSKGFLSIKTADELAEFLEIDVKKLNFLLYKVKLKYTQFEIPKKSTGFRKISAPILPLKGIQNKLKKVLDEIYRPTRATHGYISSKSIATNAAKHTNRKYLLNLDLKDFFPSINFGRVYGLLKSYPFHFPDKVAMLLAQICINDNQLPQGAPTSPIISNMICRRLDKDLIRLSKTLKVQYTRYADDLSFSWDNKEIIEELVVSKNGVTIASDQLKGIIEKNGFVINLNKIHAKTHLERQMVTGIIVNNKDLNLRRTFPRNIRAMLHAWRKFGYESAGLEYQKKHKIKHRFPLSSEPSFSHVIKGKLNYMRMVCGADHSTYLKLLTQFNQLSELINHETINSKLPDALWVIQNEDTCEQGTAFFLEGFGIVTCAHVLDGGNEIYAFKANRPDDRYPVIQKAIDKDSDVALVGIAMPDNVISLLPDFEWQAEIGKKITVAGYPNYNDAGDQIFIDRGEVVQIRNLPKTATMWIVVNAKVVAGNSGGPVLNKSNKVIGVVVTGAQSFPESDQENSLKHGFVPIGLVKQMKDRSSAGQV